MSDNKSYIEIKKSSERGFGIVFATFFVIISFYPLLHEENIKLWALLISIILFLLSFIFPKIFIIPNKLWFKLGMLLGAIIAPIIMALLYFFIATPTGIIMRLLNKDLLNQKINKSKKSYWIKRKEPINSMKNQY